jgi:hypothetical protein
MSVYTCDLLEVFKKIIILNSLGVSMDKESLRWNVYTAVFVILVLLVSAFTYFFLVKDDPESDRARAYVHRSDLKTPTDSKYLEASVMAGLWLANHQKPDGSFWYEYNPVTNEYSYEFSLLRQIGTSYSVILLYANYREEVFLETGEMALEYIIEHLDYIDEDTAFIMGGGEANLGGSALAVMGFYQYAKVKGDRYDKHLNALGDFIVSCQEDDGRLRSWHIMGGRILEPGDEFYEKHTDYYPGEAMLALAMLYDHTKEEKYLNCWKAAFNYYYDFYGGAYSPYTPFSPWATGALVMMYEYVRDERYVRMSKSMADSVLDSQALYPVGFENESYVGGFYYRRYLTYKAAPESASASDKAYQPRANTASKIEGTVDLVWLLRSFGLSGNMERYLTSSFLASDFLVQIQYNEEEAQAYDKPEWVVGGVPGGVIDPQIRIDFNQHAMVTWLKLYCFIEKGRDLQTGA